MIALVLVTACQLTRRDPVRHIEEEATFQILGSLVRKSRSAVSLPCATLAQRMSGSGSGALMPEDAEIGLLKSATSAGDQLGPIGIQLADQADSTAVCEVLFVGEFGGVAVNRIGGCRRSAGMRSAGRVHQGINPAGHSASRMAAKRSG